MQQCNHGGKLVGNTLYTLAGNTLYTLVGSTLYTLVGSKHVHARTDCSLQVKDGTLVLKA